MNDYETHLYSKTSHQVDSTVWIMRVNKLNQLLDWKICKSETSGQQFEDCIALIN